MRNVVFAITFIKIKNKIKHLFNSHDTIGWWDLVWERRVVSHHGKVNVSHQIK